MQKAMVFLQIAESSDETTSSHQFLVTYNTICSLKQGNGKKTICRMTRRPTCLVSSLYLHFKLCTKTWFQRSHHDLWCASAALARTDVSTFHQHLKWDASRPHAWKTRKPEVSWHGPWAFHLIGSFEAFHMFHDEKEKMLVGGEKDPLKETYNQSINQSIK